MNYYLGIKGLFKVDDVIIFYIPDINPKLHPLDYTYLVPKEVREKYNPEKIEIGRLRKGGEHHYIKVIFEK